MLSNGDMKIPTGECSMGNEPMEARNRLLPDWFTRVRTRQIKLPRFQRHEAWKHDQITALLNNVLRELPAGSGVGLLWKI